MAVDYLLKNGYRIVQRNFQCKLGEIDIIARHKEFLVFVEVRSRHSPTSLNPVYTVDHRKQSKIVKTASLYLTKQFARVPPARFDVAIVTLGEPSTVELIQDAFSTDGYGY